jgi:hypothetical protein
MDGLSSSRVILNDHTLALQMPGAEAVHPNSLLSCRLRDLSAAAAFPRQKVNCPLRQPENAMSVFNDPLALSRLDDESGEGETDAKP